jgi:serine/threonine-protein kinase
MKYRLADMIGSGGMAEVFRAVGEGPEGFERPFVVKRVHPRLSEAPEFVRMFVDEAKISARLIHPNIVQVFEFAYQEGGYYIVMEPVEGFDMGWLLRRLDQRREVPPPAFVAEVGRQACRGLHFAHTLAGADGAGLGIVHRDVTPPNIMVDWNGTVKILDFGIARAVQALRTSLTEAGMVKGKMAYVAPELLQGKTADARSDVFSLGVVLHELLSGRKLFHGENDLETLKLVQEMVIPPPSARNPGVKRALDAVIMRALERDPDRRCRTAGEMGNDLEAVVLRERYSTRALARKARELAPEQGAGAAPRPPAPAGGGEVDAAIDESDSVKVLPESVPALPKVRVVDEQRTGRDRRATWGSAVPSRSGWSLVVVGLPALGAAALAGALAMRQFGPPAGVAQAAAALSATAPATTVRVALDSIPQGAVVTLAATGAAAAGATAAATGDAPRAAADGTDADGRRRLGETPLVVDLPRGRDAVELELTKPGFAPLTFRVVPHQDRDVVARLEPAGAPVPAPIVASTRPTPSRRAATPSARRLSAAAGATTTTVAARGPAPAAVGGATRAPTPAAPARAATPGRPTAARATTAPATAPTSPTRR